MDIQEIMQLVTEEDVDAAAKQADEMQSTAVALDLQPMNMIAFQ